MQEEFYESYYRDKKMQPLDSNTNKWWTQDNNLFM